MRIAKRRVVYGTLIGAGTFVVGVLLVWLTAPLEQVENLPSWRAALWVFLDSNGVVLEPGITGSGLFSETVSEIPTLQLRWVFPLLLVALGTILTMSGVSGTARLRYLIENGSAVLYGYLGLGLVAFLESGARPAIAGTTALLLFLLVAMYVGSTVVEKMTGGLPFIGIAPLGFILVLGLLFVVVGVALIDAILPMVLVSVAGSATGIGLYWGVRHAPR